MINIVHICMIQNRVADPISPERSACLTQTQKKFSSVPGFPLALQPTQVFCPTLGYRSARRLYIVIMSQIIKSTFSAQGRFLQIYDHNGLKTQDTKGLNWPRLQFEVSCRQFRRLFYESSVSFLYIVSLAVLVIDCERLWYFALNHPTCSCHTSGPWVMLTNNYCHLLIRALLTQFVECFLLKMCS